ncbi:MAG: hypothetical protein AAGN82_06920 [Myxococcota bacterium]
MNKTSHVPSLGEASSPRRLPARWGRTAVGAAVLLAASTVGADANADPPAGTSEAAPPTPTPAAASSTDVSGTFPVPTKRVWTPSPVAAGANFRSSAMPDASVASRRIWSTGYRPEVIHDWRPEGGIRPDGYTEVERPNKTWFWTGALGLGVGYLASPIVGKAFEGSQPRLQGLIWIPLAGPFIHAGMRTSLTDRLALVTAGLVQLAGGTTLLATVLFPETVLVRDDVFPHRSWLSVAPWVATDHAAMTFHAAF